MTLPIINKPTFEIVQPSQDKKIVFRPFLVKEEKILLIAQSGNDNDVIRAITQILNNCAVNGDLDVNTLTTFDLEYMFIKLRARSVNNILDLEYLDLEDEKPYSFKVNLDEVELVKNENHSKVIKINDSTGIIMKYPYVSITNNIPETEDKAAILDYLISNCIDSIYDEDNVYKAEEYSPEEIVEFINNLDIETYEKIKDFFNDMPKMYYEINYENSLGTPRKIVLGTLRDFFTWG